jgi:hypothetical protein
MTTSSAKAAQVGEPHSAQSLPGRLDFRESMRESLQMASAMSASSRTPGLVAKGRPLRMAPTPGWPIDPAPGASAAARCQRWSEKGGFAER